MAKWSAWEENFLLSLKRRITLYKQECVTVEFDSTHGHFLQIDISDQIKMTIMHTKSEGWCLDLFKRNKNGSISKQFPHISRVLVPPRGTHVHEDEVCDRFYESYEKLLLEQPSFRGLYKETTVEGLQRIISSYQSRRAPQVAQASAYKEERELTKRKQQDSSNVFVGVMLGFLVLGILAALVRFL